MSRWHEIPIRVRYSEVDRMGLLYHVCHLEYFEVARSDWIRHFWRTYREIEDEGFCLVVVEAAIRYHRPARYDDELVVAVAPHDWGRSRMTFKYAIHQQAEGGLICTGETRHCFVNRDGTATRMPEELKRRLDALPPFSLYAESASGDR